MTGELVHGDVKVQTERVMENLRAVLAAGGLDFSHVVRCGVFLTDVFFCVRCGGRLGVLAYLTAPDGGRASVAHLALPSQPPRLAPAQGPAQLAWC